MIIRDDAVKKIINEMQPLVDGTGAEGTVYRFHNLAVKMFKRPVFRHLEDGYDFLHDIIVERFVLIKDKLYENDTMIGFTMDYVDDDFRILDDISMDSLISDLRIIKKDLGIFLQNSVYLVDVHKKNIMYDGHIRVIDTNPYQPLSVYTELLEKGESIEDKKLEIERDNLKHINTGLASFFDYRLSNNFSKEERERFGVGLADKMKELGNHSVFIGDYIEYDVGTCKTLGEYVNKRLHK